MSIEELAKKFATLASKPTLSKAEHEEARKLMQQLKGAGMTNEEISKLSGGKWTPSTVKFYTPGIKPAGFSPWQDVVTLLNNLISTNMTLEDVETAVTVSEDLKTHGISLDQVIDLLLTADSASIDLGTLIKQHELLKEFSLSPTQVGQALDLKKELEGEGLGLDSLKPLLELVKNYGDPQGIIEALSKYTSLAELDQETSTCKEELESLNQQLAGAHQQLKEIETKSLELKEQLDAYKKAVELGFGQAELVTLSTLAEKHGTVKKVVQAVKAFADYSDILNKVDKAKINLTNIETKIQQLETQYAHLKTATTMCNTLINQYKFGLDAITTIFSAAKKYGEPADVLKGVEVHVQLQTMQQELSKLEGAVAERKELLAQLEGKNQEALKQLESLNAMAMKAGAEVSKVESRLGESKHLLKVVDLINDPASAGYNEYGTLVVVLVKAVLQWVGTHEKNFPYPHSMKSALQNLLKELGGD